MASKMLGKRKRQGVGLEMKTFRGNDATYCGAPKNGNTRQMWKDLWNNVKVITI